MKLNKENCNKFAHYLGINSPRDLARLLGVSPAALSLYWKGIGMGYGVVRDIYNNLGEATTIYIIDFEGGNIDEFKSKYISIGKKLH